jgi:hypothetical protein
MEALADDVERMMERHQTTTDSLEAELEVVRDVTLPSLTMANQMLLSRWEAEVAIQTRRRLFAQQQRAAEE